MILDKLENIENGIIELLLKKYNVDKYNENINSFKTNFIDLDKIKEQCNIDKDLLNKYLEIDSKLCTYDIDILNLFVKYRNLYHKYKNENIINEKYTIIESIYYYFGYVKPVPKTISKDYFEKKSEYVNIQIRNIYLKLFNLL